MNYPSLNNVSVNFIGSNESLEKNFFVPDIKYDISYNSSNQSQTLSPKNFTSQYFYYINDQKSNHSFFDSNKKQTNYINNFLITNINNNTNFSNLNYYSNKIPGKIKKVISDNKTLKNKHYVSNPLNSNKNKISCHVYDSYKNINKPINEKNCLNNYVANRKIFDNIILNNNKNNEQNVLSSGIEQEYSRNYNKKFIQSYKQTQSYNFPIEGITGTFLLPNSSFHSPSKYFNSNINSNNTKSRHSLDSNNRNIKSKEKKAKISPKTNFMEKNQKNSNKSKNIKRKIIQIDSLEKKKRNNERNKNKISINDNIGKSYRKLPHNHQFRESIEKRNKIENNNKKINNNNFKKINNNFNTKKNEDKINNNKNNNNKDNYKMIKINNKRNDTKITETKNTHKKCITSPIFYNTNQTNYNKIIIPKNNELKKTNALKETDEIKKTNEIKIEIIINNKKEQSDESEKNKSNNKIFDINHYELNYQANNENTEKKLKNSKTQSMKKINILKNSLKPLSDSNSNELKFTSSAQIELYPNNLDSENVCTYNRTQYLYSENLKFKDEEEED